ncbi:MAG: Na+/H+ antiporter NhaA [Actinomycetota bacterium]|nr:Na+/H+ antiporter NhaA [Actinomycetota bacterium]
MTARPAARRLVQPLRDFLQTEASGGIVLFGATLVALVWSNSPFESSYFRLWETNLAVNLGDWVVERDLRHWVNEGLMTLFFFVVALEIKRELVHGELSDMKRAALPVVAALGGMAVPAGIYTLMNVGGEGLPGWGIPMATDIAFALGVLALVAPRIPQPAKLFLLSVAIADDIGAIIVIALGYAGGIEFGPLFAAAGLLGTMVLLRMSGFRGHPVFVILGTGVWLTTLGSGLHATIAGVAVAFITPTVAYGGDEGLLVDLVRRLRGEADPKTVRATVSQARDTVSVAERLEEALHPWSSFLIVPVFALANAGVSLNAAAVEEAIGSRVALGVVAGLVLGKVAGICGAAFLAVRAGIGTLPTGTAWPTMVGLGLLGGVGFTVSLFIADLAFEGRLTETAKIGVVAASALAGVLGAVVIRRSIRS